MTDDTLVFRSKVDAWLGAILIATPILAVASVLANAVVQGGAVLVFVGLLAVFPVSLPLWLLCSTHYTLTATELVVRCGPFSWQVPLRDIRAVQPTRNPLSSPALSLDRLRIDYGLGRSIMISPAHRERFLRELEARRTRQNPPRRSPA
jgi:hypothetical protein